MKTKLRNNLRELLLTFLVIWLPLAYALWIYPSLPENIRINFMSPISPTFKYAPKLLFIWGLPIFMTLIQLIVYGATAYRKITKLAFARFVLWIVPLTHIVVYLSILFYARDSHFNVNKSAAIFSGVMFLISGNYMPKKVVVEEKPAPRWLAYLFILAGLTAVLVGLFLL